MVVQAKRFHYSNPEVHSCETTNSQNMTQHIPPKILHYHYEHPVKCSNHNNASIRKQMLINANMIQSLDVAGNKTMKKIKNLIEETIKIYALKQHLIQHSNKQIMKYVDMSNQEHQDVAMIYANCVIDSYKQVIHDISHTKFLSNIFKHI